MGDSPASLEEALALASSTTESTSLTDAGASRSTDVEVEPTQTPDKEPLPPYQQEGESPPSSALLDGGSLCSVLKEESLSPVDTVQEEEPLPLPEALPVQEEESLLTGVQPPPPSSLPPSPLRSSEDQEDLQTLTSQESLKESERDPPSASEVNPESVGPIQEDQQSQEELSSKRESPTPPEAPPKGDIPPDQSHQKVLDGEGLVQVPQGEEVLPANGNPPPQPDPQQVGGGVAPGPSLASPASPTGQPRDMEKLSALKEKLRRLEADISQQKIRRKLASDALLAQSQRPGQ